MAALTDITEEMAQQLLDRAFIEDAAQREELLAQLMQLKGPIPPEFCSQYLVTYQQRLDAAKKSYDERIQQIESEIQDIRAWYTEDLKQAYTSEEQDREQLTEQARQFLKRSVLLEDSYKNDLENYAYALLEEWKASGRSGALVIGAVSTSAHSPRIAMYRQMVPKEHAFEPAEPLPLLAYGVGLGLFGGLSAVLWRRRARELVRLERTEQRLERKRQYTQAMDTLKGVIELQEMDVLELEAQLELEKMTDTGDTRRIDLLRKAIRKRNANIATLRAKKTSLLQAKRNQRRLHQLRRRLRHRSH